MTQRTKVDFDLTLLLDEAAGNSKVFTSPAGKKYRLVWAFVDYTSIATVGNRQLALEILDASNNVRYAQFAGAVQTASLQRFYTFGQALPYLAAFVATSYLTIPIPQDFVLPPAWKIRVRDAAAIAAGDTCKTYLFIDELPA